MEKRVVTHETRERMGGRSRSSWWLIAKNGGGSLEVLTLEGGEMLPVFSGEGEAELFLWLKQAREDGWELHESSAEELASVLCGPCSRARLVALDPSVEMLGVGATELVSLSRSTFLGRVLSERGPLPGV
jgi:hypothetical protein